MFITIIIVVLFVSSHLQGIRMMSLPVQGGEENNLDLLKNHKNTKIEFEP